MVQEDNFEVSVKKVYIKTYGCQMNEYDSSKMMDVLEAGRGMESTDNPEEADVLLLNTCSVREKAQEKVFHQLGRWRSLKQAKPGIIIGVGGCVASQEGESIIDRAPFVDVVFGPQTLHRLPELIDARERSGYAQVDISFPEIEKFDALPPAKVEGATAFVSVMEGCSKYCSFCVVPYTRGEEISRPLLGVLTEVAELAARGVQEVTLLGQNVNAWRGFEMDNSKADFATLLHYVSEVPGIERIRYTTSHPIEFTQSLIDAYAALPKLVNQLHLPVQSGSDRILVAMKRGYTVMEYKSIIRRLRKIRPDISVSSDFIIGFPGETDADFEGTLALIDEIQFDGSYSFIYSARPGTPAASLPDPVPLEIKQERLAKLQTRIDTMTHKTSLAMVSTVQRVLVDGYAKKDTNELAGRTDNNRVINFPGPVRLMNRFVDVRVTQALPHSLRGEIVI
ncbi:MAG: tRNA (N6-isopentenyl adenosine(37)-C2)-methylthiotransferase MiaB [Pseudomonadota bacterium]|nr:tRNA (N6-isopentenyl adenosine(37)-C2)-methylthiotransferase MiaB [Pseudomonadota bacterium]